MLEVCIPHKIQHAWEQQEEEVDTRLIAKEEQADTRMIVKEE